MLSGAAAAMKAGAELGIGEDEEGSDDCDEGLFYHGHLCFPFRFHSCPKPPEGTR
jgi:hypothetical protein